MTVNDGGDRLGEGALYNTEGKVGYSGKQSSRKSEELIDQLVEPAESLKSSFCSHALPS